MQETVKEGYLSSSDACGSASDEAGEMVEVVKLIPQVRTQQPTAKQIEDDLVPQLVEPSRI